MGFMDIFIKPEEGATGSNEVKQNTAPAQSVQQTPVAQSAPSTTMFQQPVVQNTAPASSATIADGEYSEDIAKQLYQKILDSDIKGPDYLELRQNTAALANLGLTEEKQYEGAFNVLKASYPNFSKEIILNSIDTYIGVVQNEASEGKKQCEAKRKSAIGDKQTRVTQLKETANDILLQIDELKKKYDEINQSVENLNNEIAVSTLEIDNQEKLFNNSIQYVINSLNSDKTKISSLNI